MSEIKVRGVRGAVTVDADDAGLIHDATRRLLLEIVTRNEIAIDDIASVLFTLTPDIRAAFPALAARDMGWTHVAMLHAVEIDVPGAIRRCIRVMLQFNTTRAMPDIEHVYLGEAARLRPDLVRTT
jgi:chorismate mutase